MGSGIHIACEQTIGGGGGSVIGGGGGKSACSQAMCIPQPRGLMLSL